MNVLIIGGSGLVGGNLLKELSSSSVVKKVIGTHLSYPTSATMFLDTLAPFPEEILSVKWDAIIHTGALTHVDKCEAEVDLSYNLTVESTKKLLELANSDITKFIYISTDYVFNGKYGPYTEEDQVSPLNIYGRHKLLSEELVKVNRNHLIIRITNVYGQEDRNKNFVSGILTKLQNTDIIEIDVPTDQYATPINAADVAKAITLLLLDNKIGTYHLASTDYMSRYQLVSRINKYVNNRITANGKTTQQLSQKALRPLNGGLKAAKFLLEYPDFNFSNLDDFLKQTIC